MPAYERVKKGYTRVPVNEATQPPQGGFVQIYRDRWWYVIPEQEILVYEGQFPQCNSYKEIMNGRKANESSPDIIKNSNVVQIPLVFIKIHMCDCV